MKVNLGSGDFPLEGYVNVDQHSDKADVLLDMREAEFEGVDEVVMTHSLEHIPYRDVPDLLERIRSWMVPGGKLLIEVPDMRGIMAQGERVGWPLWVAYIYGSQNFPGEIHYGGFCERDLRQLLEWAGWSRIETREFSSPHPYRLMMPCLEATAYA